MASKLKPLTPVGDQIAAYLAIFEGWRRMQEWDAANPQPPLEAGEAPFYLRSSSGTPRGVHYAERAMFVRSLEDAGWDHSHWNWDPDYDQPLIDRVQSLADRGIEIVRFYRKRKIDVRVDAGWDRATFVQAVCDTIGDDWVGMSFTRNIASIWWKGGGPWKNYR